MEKEKPALQAADSYRRTVSSRTALTKKASSFEGRGLFFFASHTFSRWWANGGKLRFLTEDFFDRPKHATTARPLGEVFQMDRALVQARADNTSADRLVVVVKAGQHLMGEIAPVNFHFVVDFRADGYLFHVESPEHAADLLRKGRINDPLSTLTKEFPYFRRWLGLTPTF